MSKIIQSILISVMLCAISSCKKELSSKELRDYISDPEHGITKKKNVSGVNFNLLYMPENLPAGNAVSQTGNYVKDTSLDYFILKINVPASGKSVLKSFAADNADYLQKLYYVQTKMQKDFNLTSAGSNSPCLFLHYEDDHGIAQDVKLILAFKKIKTEEDLIVEYDDAVFGLGLIKFRFKREDLNTIPDLKI